MKEITNMELVKALNNKTVEIDSVDVYGVSVSMSKATVSYDELCDRIIFTCGDYNHGGVGTIAYKMDDCFESVTYDETDGSYTIEFNQFMADLVINTTRKIRKIES